MDSIESFKIAGPVSVLITWLAIAYILLRQPRDISKSISHHAARRDKDYKIFAVLMTIGVLLMLLFITKWLQPMLRLPDVFLLVAGIAILLELIATWVPLTEGRSYSIHQFCSYGAAILVPIVLLFLAFSGHITGIAKFINFAAIVIIVAFMGLFIFVKKTHKHYLWYQTVDILIFHISILAVAYAA
jgi:hypothetical protein